MYLDAKHPDHKNASKEQRKEWKKEAKARADYVSDELKDAKLRRAAKQVNIAEKAEDRITGRRQNAVKYNEAETIFTEAQLKEMLDTTAMIMGKDAFAKALHTKLSTIRPDAGLLKWDNMAGLNQALGNPNQAQLIRGILKDNLPYMTASSLQEWLSAERPGEELDLYRAAIEAQHGVAIDNILDAAYPNLTQKEMAKKRGEVIGMIAAGVMQVTDRSTGMSIRGAGVGAGVTFTGIDRVTPLISRISIGAGISDKGIPGIAIDFGKDIKRNTGAVHLDAGAANFIIPFARISVDQTINTAALRKNLEAKRAWKVGAYAEAAPAYMGAGINVGNNLVEGITQQERNIETQIFNAIVDLEDDNSVVSAMQQLKRLFPKADNKLLQGAAQHIIDGLKQGYNAEDIAATFAAAWKNEAIKNTRGKVDVSLEAGVGTLVTVPVIKAFVGAKFYRKAVMLEDKFDKSAKEQQLSTFKDFQKFENADVKGMSMKEKIAYWLGDKATVTENEKTITITSKNPKVAIFDQFDVYIKDQRDVRVNNNEIIFSKGSNILMGRLIGSQNGKEKIYIGYDRQADVEAEKFPINAKVYGTPELLPYQEEKIIKSSKKETLNLSFEANLDAADAKFVVDSIKGKIFLFEKMTHPSNKTRLAFNKQFGEFVTSTRGSDFALMKSNIEKLNKMSGLFNEAEKKTFDAIWNKSDEHKRALVNALIQTGSYSARLLAIVEGKGLPGSKNLGELLKKRNGHIEAFKNSGINIDKTAFSSIYEKAKEVGTKKPYTEAPVDNAVALVSYYRSGLTPTTGLIGFGDVQVLAGAEYREDASKETAVFDKFMEIYTKSADFAAQKITMQKEIEKFIPGAKLDEAGIITLIKTGKLTLNGQEIKMTGNAFEKMLNGPCANEGYMLSFGKIELTVEKEEKIPAKKGNIYVGMEHIDNYQRARSVKVGVGTMYGDKPAPQPKQPEYENGNPVSNPGDSGEPTDV